MATLFVYLANKNEGVALQSTIARFKQSIQAAPQKVFLSNVSYIDYKKQRIPLGNLYYGCTHKRASFAHENEVRALYGDQETLDAGIEVIQKNELSAAKGWHDEEFVSAEDWEPIQKGFLILTDLDTLIDKVHVAPTSQEWFRNLVESVLRKYSHPQAVEKSDLMTAPVW